MTLICMRKVFLCLAYNSCQNPLHSPDSYDFDLYEKGDYLVSILFPQKFDRNRVRNPSSAWPIIPPKTHYTLPTVMTLICTSSVRALHPLPPHDVTNTWQGPIVYCKGGGARDGR